MLGLVGDGQAGAVVRSFDGVFVFVVKLFPKITHDRGSLGLGGLGVGTPSSPPPPLLPHPTKTTQNASEARFWLGCCVKPAMGFIGRAKPTETTWPEIPVWSRAEDPHRAGVEFGLSCDFTWSLVRGGRARAAKMCWHRETRTIHRRGFLFHPRSRHHSFSRVVLRDPAVDAEKHHLGVHAKV